MKKLLIVLISLVVLLILILLAGRFYIAVNVPPSQAPVIPTPPSGIYCTMDAKICPDGSAVGRIAPSCEFALCPASPIPKPSSGPISLMARIGERVGGLGVTITPLEVLEDSRCPVNANCIWAGTVRLRTRVTSAIGTSEETFVLDTPVMTEAETITLSAVAPQPIAGSKKDPAAYRFTFTVSKR